MTVLIGGSLTSLGEWPAWFIRNCFLISP